MSTGGSFSKMPPSGGATGNNPFTSQQPPQQAQQPSFGGQFQQPSGSGFGQPFGSNQQFGGGFGQQFGGGFNPQFGGGFGQPFGGGFNQQFGGGFGGGFGNPFGAIISGLGSLFGGYNPMPYGGYQSYQPPQPRFNYQPPQQFPGNAYVRPLPEVRDSFTPSPPPPPTAPPPPPPPIGPVPPDIDWGSMPVGVMGGGDEYWRPGGGKDQQAAATEAWWARQTGGGRPAPPMGGQALQPTEAQGTYTNDFGSPDERRVREIMSRSMRDPGSVTPEDRSFLMQQEELKNQNSKMMQDQQIQRQRELLGYRSPYMSMGGIGSFFGGSGLRYY